MKQYAVARIPTGERNSGKWGIYLEEIVESELRAVTSTKKEALRVAAALQASYEREEASRQAFLVWYRGASEAELFEYQKYLD